MNAFEKLRMIGMLARTQIEEVWERFFFKVPSLVKKRVRVNLDKIVLPDTRVVIEAAEYVRGLYTASMFNHCYRTYFWGSLLAQYDNLKLDAELFLVANLFHDIGLTDDFIKDATVSCFTRQCGRVAEDFVKERGWSETKAKRVYQAISLHLNPYINPTTYGAEEALVGAAATLDLLGVNHRRIPIEIIRQVNTRYNRNSLNQDFGERMQQHKHHPDTRACFYAKLGATELLVKNPLNRQEFQR